jgi:exopolysaccharide production protein ExoY
MEACRSGLGATLDEGAWGVLPSRPVSPAFPEAEPVEPDVLGTEEPDESASIRKEVMARLALAQSHACYHHRSRLTIALYEGCKRILDVIGALALLVLALPLLVAIACLVKATSPGPVLFKHRRLGRGGREFWCLKFRTMVADAEARLARDAELRRQFEKEFKLQEDPRVTPLGRFLRKSSLDELPQLWNVLVGDMSLIGPRPVVKAEIPKYGRHMFQMLTVRPGLSGLWQVCGRSDTTYDERVQMDMLYIDHRCLRLDLMLICLTIGAVVRKHGAC